MGAGPHTFPHSWESCQAPRIASLAVLIGEPTFTSNTTVASNPITKWAYFCDQQTYQEDL